MPRKRKSVPHIDEVHNTHESSRLLNILADEFTKENIRDELAKHPKELHVEILEDLIQKFKNEPIIEQVLEVISDLPKEDKIRILESLKAHYIALEN